MATIQHRSNCIASLTNAAGDTVTDHEAKAQRLHDAFKDRLGQSEPYSIPPELLNLIRPHSGLDCLEQPFTHKEIDDVIEDLTSNKSPGPDGFNTDFIKKCWHVIKKDFYDLCDQFYRGELCLQSMNSGFITLISKKAGALGLMTIDQYLS